MKVMVSNEIEQVCPTFVGACVEADVESLVRDCMSATPMFFDGGGVTLTGGEVCMQLPSVKELLTRLGAHGIHRAIETNGSIPRAAELIPLVDEWIMDFKHYDDSKHRKWLGVGSSPVLETLKVEVVETVLLVQHIDHTLFDGLDDND